MPNQNGPGPAPLRPQVINKLLDLLSSDDDFRALFQRDAHAALVRAGYEPSADADPAQAAALSGASCMQLSMSDTLASKEKIAQDRQKLERSLSLVQIFEHAPAFRE